jgi:pimeloyl-ACP methyl ester carboxylesterase
MTVELEQHRQTVSTEAGPISVIDIGDGPAAVFVHGVGTNALLWRHVIADLCDDRRCVAVDLPLHGHSPATDEQDLSLGALAEAVIGTVTALDIGPVDLVANDTGGAIAQIVAARQPTRLRSLTLTNCETEDNIPPAAFAPTVDLARQGLLAPSAPALLADLGAARAAVFAMGYEDEGALPLDVVAAFLQPVMGTPERARRFERLLAGLVPDDLIAARPALTRLDVPTLLVWGTGDEFFDIRWAHWLRDTIPGAKEIVELPGAKLFFPDERAAELVGHLRRFWSDVAERAQQVSSSPVALIDEPAEPTTESNR